MKVDLVIDIETLVDPVTASDVEAYMKEYEPPANYKTPEAILRHREKTEREAVDKIASDRRFTIGGKRMVSAALGLVSYGTNSVEHIESWSGNDLLVITKGVVEYLNDYNEYRLIGWNHKRFDLPEIAKSFAKTGVRPKNKPSKWDLIDLCDFPFSKTKLKDAALAFGLSLSEFTGEDIAKLHHEENWEAIMDYNEHDVEITGKLFLAASTIFTF